MPHDLVKAADTRAWLEKARMDLRSVVPAGAALLLVAALGSRLNAQTVTGVVLDAETERTVFGASVRVLDSTAHPIALVVTDSVGSYAVTLPAPGRYSFEVRAWGYEPAEVITHDLQGGERLILWLRRAAQQGSGDGLLGVVVDDNPRRPVPDAAVLLLDAHGYRTVVTPVFEVRSGQALNVEVRVSRQVAALLDPYNEMDLEHLERFRLPEIGSP